MNEDLDLESFTDNIYNTKGFKSLLCVSDQNKSFVPHFFYIFATFGFIENISLDLQC